MDDYVARTFSPRDRDLDDPGWTALMEGIIRFSKRHPIDCGCAPCTRFRSQQNRRKRLERERKSEAERIFEPLRREDERRSEYERQNAWFMKTLKADLSECAEVLSEMRDRPVLDAMYRRLRRYMD